MTMTKIVAMPSRNSSTARNVRFVTTRLTTSSQGQHLTVPLPLETTRGTSNLGSEASWDGKNALCVKLCLCVAIVFLFCVLTVFIYSILLAKYSDYEPKINNDSLLAALVRPKEPTY